MQLVSVITITAARVARRGGPVAMQLFRDVAEPCPILCLVHPSRVPSLLWENLFHSSEAALTRINCRMLGREGDTEGA